MARSHHWLSFWVFLTLTSAPVEGYLQELHSGLSKLPAAALILSWSGHLMYRRRFPHLHLISWFAGVLLVLVAASSAVNSGFSAFGAADASGSLTPNFTRWVPFLILLIVLVDLLAGIVDIQVAITAIVVGASISAAGGLYSFLVLGEPRASGPLPDPNDLALVLVAALPLALAMPPRKSVASRIWRWPVAFIIVVGTTATLSRGAAVAFVVLATWAIGRRFVSRGSLLISAVALIIAASSLWLFAGALVTRAVDQKDFVAQGNINSRAESWAAAMRMLAEHPILGVGPGGARLRFAEASGDADIAEQLRVTHNMYLEVAAELGLMGFVVFLSIIVVAFICSELVRSNEGRRIAMAVQASLIAVCTASIFLSTEYYLPLWAAVAMAAALQLRDRRRIWASL